MRYEMHGDARQQSAVVSTPYDHRSGQKPTFNAKRLSPVVVASN